MVLYQLNSDNEECLSYCSFNNHDNHGERRRTIIRKDRLAIRQALAVLEQEDEEEIVTEEVNTDIELPSNNTYRMEDVMKIRRRNNRTSSISSSGKKANQGRKSRSVGKKQQENNTRSKANDELSHNDESSLCNSAVEPERKERASRTTKSKRNIHTITTRINNNKNKQSNTSPLRRCAHEERKKEDDESINTSTTTSGRRGRENETKLVVGFSDYDQVVNIPHILDIPQEEIDARWMNEEDGSFIRCRSLRLIKMMEDGKHRYPIWAGTNTMIVNNHLVCVRGLEEQTSQRVNEREELQRKLYNAVFRVQQQHREKDGGGHPQESIRRACAKYSKQAAKAARLVGISDEANASSSSRQYGHRYNVVPMSPTPTAMDIQ